MILDWGMGASPTGLAVGVLPSSPTFAGTPAVVQQIHIPLGMATQQFALLLRSDGAWLPPEGPPLWTIADHTIVEMSAVSPDLVTVLLHGVGIGNTDMNVSLVVDGVMHTLYFSLTVSVYDSPYVVGPVIV